MMYMPLRPTSWKASVNSGSSARNCRARSTKGTLMGLAIEPPDQADDAILLCARDELVDRQRQRRCSDPFGDREVAALVAEKSGGGLQMHRRRIVHLGIDAVGDQVVLQFIAPLAQHHIEMIDLIDM